MIDVRAEIRRNLLHLLSLWIGVNLNETDLVDYLVIYYILAWVVGYGEGGN